MRKVKDHLEVVDTMLTEGVRRGVLHLHSEDESLNGRHIVVDGRRLVNFGSCSYLGLDMDERLKAAAIDAIKRYGPQFSSSRTYLSSPPYRMAEALLTELFGGHIAMAPTTSLIHLATIPIVVDEDDAIILDQQVHHSVQSAVNQVRLYGTVIELNRHNNIADLEERINRLRERHRRIWFFIDGVYSMYGDLPPIAALVRLLETCPQFHLYVDDAHGMSWYGEHGRGSFLGRVPLHPRMIVTTSFNKAFGAGGGGVAIFPNAELCRKVRTCGGPLVFTGPIAAPILGAIIASAKIHLSPEIRPIQKEAQDRMDLCNDLFIDKGLPLLYRSQTPLRYIPMGLPKVAYAMSRRLMADGLFANVAIFPAVAMKRGGLRVALTRHLRTEDLERLADAIAGHFLDCLEQEEEGGEDPIATFQRNFDAELDVAKLERARRARREGRAMSIQPTELGRSALSLQHETTVASIPQQEWDSLLGDRGSFTWAGLALLERVFRDNPEQENNWQFHYYIVREPEGKIVLATFFTEVLVKDDIIAPKRVSALVEKKRASDKYFLTTKALSMGSWLTEGDHLFLDRASDWRSAMRLLLDEVAAEQARSRCNIVTLRDLWSDDVDLDAFLLNEGFVKFAMPESFVLEVSWRSDEEYDRLLSKRARAHRRKHVLPFESRYEVKVTAPGSRVLSEFELDHMFKLYQNVKARGLELNTFELPRRLLTHLQEDAAWEFILLYPTVEGGVTSTLPAAWVVCFIGKEHYVPLICGLDYDYVVDRGAYRVMLSRIRKGAERRALKRILLGMGAPLEKQRLGAQVQPRSIYIQSKDDYQGEVLQQMMADAMGIGRT